MMHLADTLSSAYLSANPTTKSCEQMESVNIVEYLPISEPRIRDIQLYTEADENLQVLKHTILSGWPETKEDVQVHATLYFHFRDDLNVHNSVIFQGETAVIPKAPR